MSTRPVHRSRLSEPALARVQAVSGLAFASFLVLHLLTALAAVFGQRAYDGALTLGRVYYQALPIELTVVLLSLVVHVAASVTRARRRRRGRGSAERRRPHAGLRLHRVSAYFLLIFIFGHITATRAPAIFADVPIEFAFVHYSLVNLPAYFVPYYTLLFAAGAYHGLRGIWVALGVLGLPRPQAPRALTRDHATRAAAALALVGLLVVSALAGVWYAVDTTNFPIYDALAARVFGG
ncbi:MAG: hypothetical protein KC468_01605 [Myxococcales bacterium]|nr:hypothetical protein [Myxococcales bacterium]